PVVLITGALTGIGRAAALAFAQEGARLVVSGRREKEGRELDSPSCKGLEQRPFLSILTSAMRMKCGIWWIRGSPDLVIWTLQSIALEPRANLARGRNRPQKPTLRRSIQTSWVRCSA